MSHTSRNGWDLRVDDYIVIYDYSWRPIDDGTVTALHEYGWISFRRDDGTEGRALAGRVHQSNNFRREPA